MRGLPLVGGSARAVRLYVTEQVGYLVEMHSPPLPAKATARGQGGLSTGRARRQRPHAIMLMILPLEHGAWRVEHGAWSMAHGALTMGIGACCETSARSLKGQSTLAYLTFHSLRPLVNSDPSPFFNLFARTLSRCGYANTVLSIERRLISRAARMRHTRHPCCTSSRKQL